MATRTPWRGPFKFDQDGRTCVKCDRPGDYKMMAMGWPVMCCREHAIEGLCSKEGGMTLAEAESQIADADAETFRIRNTFTRHWIPCSERLPDHGVDVLVYYPASDARLSRISIARFMGEKSENGDCLFWYDGYGANYATHWMPLPTFPQCALHNRERSDG